MLPPGSVLQGVMLPRYDEKRRLTSVLHAEILTLIDEDNIRGDKVLIEIFNLDGTRRAKIDLAEAHLDQKKGILTAKQNVQIQSDRLTASGTGILFDLATTSGFLIGPVTTTITAPPPDTAMITTPRATGSILAALTLPLISAPPPRMTAEEIAALQADAASRAETVAAEGKKTNETLTATLAEAQAAQTKTLDFLNQNGLTLIANEAENNPAEAEAKPLEVDPDPNNTVISCENGMYFDSEEGVLVYLKNVTVKDPRFTITGANELKIFFTKKPEKPTEEKDPATEEQNPDDKKESGLDLGIATAGFGDVSRIVATGAVRILQKGVDGKEPIEASAAILSYNLTDKQIILSGGYPWVKQGTTYARATRPNERLRILTSGTFHTEGFWDMGGNLNQNR